VAAYRVLVGGKEARRIGYPLAEFGAAPGASMEFNVVAEDGSGNRSEPSQPLIFGVP